MGEFLCYDYGNALHYHMQARTSIALRVKAPEGARRFNMKRFLAIAIALILIFACGTLTSCQLTGDGNLIIGGGDYAPDEGFAPDEGGNENDDIRDDLENDTPD